MNKLIFWCKNARMIALPQSMLPAFVALGMASAAENFSFLLGIAAVAGVALGHLGMNLFDDYFDYKAKKTDYRNEMAQKGIRARVAKCHYLVSEAATLRELLFVACLFGFSALAIGGIILMIRGVVILYLALATIFLGIFYSGNPLRLSYRGLGEIVVGLTFGPLLMCGVYYAACGSIDKNIVLMSVSVGLLVANILFTHSIMDYEPDKHAGKMTFAILLKSKKKMLFALFFLLFTAFSILIFGVVFNIFPKVYLFVLLVLPMAVSLFYLMTEFVKHPMRTFKPKFWMGPMGDWKKMEKAGIDWFMIRWLLARNLLSFFCFIIIIIHLIASL